jgi:hypothetical protein
VVNSGLKPDDSEPGLGVTIPAETRVHRDRPTTPSYSGAGVDPFDSSQFTNAQQVHPNSRATTTEPTTPAEGGRENKRMVERKARLKELRALRMLREGIESTPDTVLMGVLEETPDEFKGKNADPTQIKRVLSALNREEQSEGQLNKKSKSHKANMMALAGTLIK